MIKFLFIFLFIIGVVLLFLLYIQRQLKLLFKKFSVPGNQKSGRKSEDDILYRKDDVVVLKGEANHNKNKKDTSR